jgi:hypothetical protein
MVWLRNIAHLAVILLVASAPLFAARGQSPPVEAGDYTPSPRVAEVIAALQRTEAAIESLEVEYVCLSNLQFGPPGKPPLAGLIEDDAVAMIRRATVSWVAHRDGRARVDAEFERTNVRQDGSEVRHEEDHVSAFDGQVGAMITRRRLPTGEIFDDFQSTNGVVSTHHSPFDLTVRVQGTPVSEVLTLDRAKELREDEIEGRRVAVVETQAKAVRPDYILRREFWIDVERGVVVRRRSLVQRGPDKPWGQHLLVDATRFAEVRPGVWLPGAVSESNWTVGEAGGDFLVSRESYAFDAWTVNGEIDPQRFAVPDPP